VKRFKTALSARFVSASVVTAAALVTLLFWVSDRGSADDDAARVVKDYLTATYAHDLSRAYALISARDKKIVGESDYLETRGAYTGFALRLAQELASAMEFKVVEDTRNGTRVHIKATTKLPAPEDLSPLVGNWDTKALNALPTERQQEIVNRVARLRRNDQIVMVESQETFQLIREGKNWRLFFDWASGTRVTFDFRAPPESGIEMDFTEKEIIAKPKEPFLVHFTVKNAGKREVAARIIHRIQPEAAGETLQMIQCGLLSPIDLAPGNEREMASVYFLDSLPEDKRVSITYDFQIEPASGSLKPNATSPGKGR
jgi:cytochrome c oxidase assembly protein CtaG/Cox11